MSQDVPHEKLASAREKRLNGGMMAGMRIGRVPGGTLGTEIVPTEEALPRLRAAFTRLATVET